MYWPFGNSTFPGLHPDIIQLTEGVTFLGTPVWGTDSYISSYVADIIWKVKQLQSSILELNDPQVELHLLRSCLGIGKVNHILRTVQPDLIAKELDDFDNLPGEIEAKRQLENTLNMLIEHTTSQATYQAGHTVVQYSYV